MVARHVMLPHNNYGRAQCGSYGELIVAAYLTKLGWDVCLQSGSHNQCDLIARSKHFGKIRISVKTSNGRIQSGALKPQYIFGFTSNPYNSADLIAFVCITDRGPVIKFCKPEIRYRKSYNTTLNGRSWIEKNPDPIPFIPIKDRNPNINYKLAYIKFNLGAALFKLNKHVYLGPVNNILYHVKDERLYDMELVISSVKQDGRWKIPISPGYDSVGAYIESTGESHMYDIMPEDIEKGYILH